MKIMKKAMAMMMSLVMMLAMCVTAWADEIPTYKITAPATNHIYEIYQIFTGDLNNGVLSNVKWGQNGTGEAGTEVSDETLKVLADLEGKSDREKLDEITKYASLKNPVATITQGASYDAPAGYYLIKDQDGSVKDDDVYTTYIVLVSQETTIAPKADVPSFEKKLKDTNDTTGETSGWQDSADYDIGDEIPFKLEGSVTAKYDDYKTYYLVFHDKEETGLQFNADSVHVYVDENEITAGYTVTENPTDGCSFEVVFSNLKTIPAVHAGSNIRVEYTSTLTEDAVLGNQGNVNQAKMEFSNNPNSTQDGTPETGETPWDNVIVFTYKVVVDKVANSVDGDKLPGAEFTLEKVLKNGNKELIDVVKSDNGTTFTFKGLDDGDYILTETVTPAGYNTIKPITFTVTAEHKIEWNGEDRKDLLTGLTGNAASGSITFTASADNSELDTKVVNKQGITLPGTGGMGTTIFYVVGSILMLGAAVLLITQKRLNTKNRRQ